MAKVNKIVIKTRFDNGSVSFVMSDGRVIKLSKSTIDDLVNLVAGRRVCGDSVSLFQQYFLSSSELICGPNNEQKETWSKSPLWEHKPYTRLHEVIAIVGLLTDRNLSALVSFTYETEWRHSGPYWSFRRQNLDTVGAAYYGDRSNVCTTIVDEETFKKMKGGG